MKGLMKIFVTTMLIFPAVIAFAQQGPGDDSREPVRFDAHNMDPQTITVVNPANGMTKDQPIKMTPSLEPQTTKVQVNGSTATFAPATFSPGKNDEPVSGRIRMTAPKK